RAATKPSTVVGSDSAAANSERKVSSTTALEVSRCRGSAGAERYACRRMPFLEEYVKHTALNLGQALQGLRYLTSHPDVDPRASRGVPRHALLAVALRSRRVANDLFFAAIPPHWHHTADELRVMTTVPIGRWFQYGYCAWRFAEDGAPRRDLGPHVDRRWDPR